MSFIQKIQTVSFWVNVFKVAFPFFIIVTIISLFMNNSSDIFSGNFSIVKEANFSGGKWKTFWSYKLIFSFVYGIWITQKNTKKS